MNLTIIARDIPVNAELEDMMHHKLADLEKIYTRITGYEVTMKKTDKEDRNCEIEGRVLVSKNSFFCRERAETFELALEQVIENLARQLKRQKEERIETW